MANLFICVAFLSCTATFKELYSKIWWSNLSDVFYYAYVMYCVALLVPHIKLLVSVNLNCNFLQSVAQHVNKVYNQMLVTFFGIDGMTALNMYLR